MLAYAAKEKQDKCVDMKRTQISHCFVLSTELNVETHTSHPPRRVSSSINTIKPPTSSRNLSASDDLPAATHWKVAFWPAFISSSPSLEKCGALSKDTDTETTTWYQNATFFGIPRHNNWQCFQSFLLVTFKHINKSFKIFFIIIDKLFLIEWFVLHCIPKLNNYVFHQCIYCLNKMKNKTS